MFAGCLVTASNNFLCFRARVLTGWRLSSTVEFQIDSTSLTQLKSQSETDSELLYDERFTASQFLLAASPWRSTTSIFFLQLNICGYSSYVTFTITAIPSQRSHVWFRVSD